MRRPLLLLLIVSCVPPSSASAQDVELKRPPRFRIDVQPQQALRGVPVKSVTITALDADGDVDASYNGRPLIEGVMLTVRDMRSGAEVDTALGGFRDGVLKLETDQKAKEPRKVYVTSDEIVVDPKGRDRTSQPVQVINRWWSLLPPLLAIVLAVLLKNVYVALFAGIWSGGMVLLSGAIGRGDAGWIENLLGSFTRTLDTYILQEITQDGRDTSHLLIIFFTMFLGAMVGVMARSGGTEAIVRSLARFSRTREQGQVLTWCMGFAVFFDDYANTLLVGGTMRPVTDRLKISREKLAFLVDSTAAPVAGLAVISTWVGVEVGYIQDSYQQLFGDDVEWNAYSTFIATIPFRFYILHLLVFVLLIAYSGHDFGPMLRAEVRALQHGDLGAVNDDVADAPESNRALLRNALVPLFVLIASICVGFWWTGSQGLEAANAAREAKDAAPVPTSLWSLLEYSSSNRVIFFSAFLASISAIAVAVGFRSLNLSQATEGWLSGAKSMFGALLVLVMAWAIATICNPDHLNTAGFLVELVAGRVSAAWIPSLAFLLAAAVSFATGSSFTTMGLLMPLFITMTFNLLVLENDVDPNHQLLLATIGAVLAGAIFGDHCSPISDTTVLSSAATGCDHLRHVATQLPYAVSVAGVALLLGYLPVGLGFSPLIMLPLSLVALYALVMFVGRPVEAAKDSLPVEPAGGARKRESPAAADPASADDDKEPAEPPPPVEETEEERARRNLDQVSLEDVDVDWDSLPE